ncbi:MAG: FAD-dependent oxidoreductase [Planctomycetes bacterium]|nr:FAD-dependent oxidoreductase [Planctomycetota bacterium]
MTVCDHLVVGAGVHGLCTAFWLVQRRAGRIVVCDQFEPGHARGSSHGETRITRSSYDDPTFVAMAQEAHRDCWPALEAALGRPLRLATPGVFFGPAEGPFASYAGATLGSGAAVEALDVATARAKFPLLRFADDDGVLLDHTAAVVLAAAMLRGLAAWLTEHGVDMRWNTPVSALAVAAGGVVATTPTGTVHARTATLATGPWTGRLRAAAAGRLAVQPQEIGYFAAANPAAATPGVFPVWARIGRTAEDFHYGLPDVGRGLKLALHRTTGPAVDPDAVLPPVDEPALRALAAARFAAPTQLRRSERCLYTMADGHALRVQRAADAPVVTIAACSGHAFKFGPLLGRRAADLALAT